MKRCYNYEILWVSVFALIILVVVALQPYKAETKEMFEKLDGEDMNSHSCPKLMNNSLILKDHYKKFNKNAKTIASFMEPGLSEKYMETDSKKHLKGMCIIPDNKISSYELNLMDDPVKGGPSQICKGVLEDKKTNKTIEVVMPYVRDVNSGCALVFNDYANDPKKVEDVLTNLQKLSDQYNEKAKQRNLDQKDRKQNEHNSYISTNNQLNNQRQNYDARTRTVSSSINKTQPELDMINAVNYQLRQQNQQLKEKQISTW